MTSPQTLPPTGDLLLAHAYADGELTLAEALAFEQQRSGDPAAAAEADGILRLRKAMRGMPAAPVPNALRERILRATASRPRARPTWAALAASLVAAAMLGASAGYLAPRPDPVGGLEQAILSGHRRGLMAPAPTDVASSDRHTVKPWFAGRIPQAPRVVDLTTQGYALLGGRIDVIGRMPSPTLVYRHRQHLISLTQVANDARASSPRLETRDGYHLLHWAEDGITYWAVSDLSAGDLEAFARAFRAAPAEG